MSHTDKPIANPLIVLREEFDDWAILFDPDSGDAFGLNPIGVHIWKDEAEGDLQEFIEDLVQRGLAGYEIQKV